MAHSILIGIKPGASSERLLALAEDLVAPPSTVHLASFVTVGTDEDEPQRYKEAEAHLAEIASDLESRGYETKTHVQINALSAGSGLVRLAADHDVDLLFLGIVKRSRVGKALMGSDAQTAILTAPCPVVSSRTE